MTKKQAWVNALRLRTLPLSLSGILFGSGLAFYYQKIDWLIFALAMLTTVFFQILSNLANDLGDSMKGTDNSNRIGPMRSVQSGLISISEMKKAVLFMSIISFVLAVLLLYFGSRDLSNSVLVFYFVLAIICIIAALTYTLGKKAYGYSGFGDLMVFIFFGPVSVIGVYILYVKNFDMITIYPAITFGLLSVAVLNLNNMRDIINDAKSNKKTLVVKMGSDMAKFYHSIILVGAISCYFLFLNDLGFKLMYWSLLPFAVIIFHLYQVMQIKNTKDFDPHLKVVALSTFAVAIISFIIFLSSSNI